jgi:hypothetical protein
MIKINGGFSLANAPAIFALRVALNDLQEKKRQEQAKEEESLRQLFLEAGGNPMMLDKSVNLSDRAMRQMLENTAGTKNLARLRESAAAATRIQ